MEYDPPILNYLLKKNGVLDIKYLKYKRQKNNFIDHLYDNMENFLLKLSLNLIDFQDEKYGYYCEKKNNQYIEGLYAIVDLKLLEEKITSDINFPKDDFKNPNDDIARNAFKSRALSLEYYINNSFLLKDLKVKERPRVIYLFKSIDKIKKIDEKNNLNNLYIDANNSLEKDDKEMGIIEVDGIILENNQIRIDLNEKIFIQDKCYNFSFFKNENDSNESIDCFVKSEPKQTIYNFILQPKTLCVIEVKNQFPPNEIYVKNKNIPNQGKAFNSIIKDLIDKAFVFKTIYEQKNYELNQIKLILFYDAIHKYNYEEELKKVMNEKFKKDNAKLLEKIQFQCIYVKASYLSGTYSSITNELEKLKSEIKALKEELMKKKNN